MWRLHEVGHFSFHPGQAGFCFFKAESWLSRDNIFHINNSSSVEKHPAFFKRRACVFNILKKQRARAAGEKIVSKFTNKHIKIPVPEFTAAKEKNYQKWSLPVWFFGNPANMTTMYSEHFQQLKRSSLQEKFCVAAFLIRNTFENICVFDFTK